MYLHSSLVTEAAQNSETKEITFSALTKFKFCLLNIRRTNASVLSVHWVYSNSHEEYFLAFSLAYPDCLECGGSWNPGPDQRR